MLLVNYSDDVSQPWTTSYIDGLYNSTTDKSVRTFWEWSSFGQYSITADVYGYFVLAAPVHGGFGGSCTSLNTTETQADAAAAAAGINEAAYQYIVYWRVSDTASSNCGASTAEDVGPLPRHEWLWMDPNFCSPTATYGCLQSLHVPIHEFGHNLGLEHAGQMDCTTGTGIVTIGPIAGTTCAFQDYLNQWSVMGNASGAGTTLGNTQRVQMGWIPPSQVVTLTATSTFTVTSALDSTSLVYRVADGRNDCGFNEPQYQGATYPNPPVDCYLYFENRAAGSAWDPTSWPTTGQLLLHEFSGSGFSRMLDANPTCTCIWQTYWGPANNTDPGLRIGASVTLPNGVVVTNAAFDGASNTVSVVFP